MQQEIVINTVRSSDGTTIAYSRDGSGQALPDTGRRTIAGQQHDADPALLPPVLREFFAN